MGPAHRSRFLSRAAVIVTLAALPILWTPNVVVARKVVGRGRRSIIEKGGWATMAGTDAPSSAVVTGQATCCGSHPATSASTILVCCSVRIARRSSGRPVAPVGCPSGSAGRGPRDRTGRYHPAEIETGIRRQKNYRRPKRTAIRKQLQNAALDGEPPPARFGSGKPRDASIRQGHGPPLLAGRYLELLGRTGEAGVAQRAAGDLRGRIIEDRHANGP